MTLYANDALAHKHILITGATGGIGYQAAKVVAGMGAKITITGRNEEKLNALAEEHTSELQSHQLSRMPSSA